MHNKVRIINHNDFSSFSLTLHPFQFGNCFPHDRRQFCSPQSSSSSSPSFSIHIPQAIFNIIHPPQCRFFFLPPGLSSSYFFTCPVPSTLTMRPTYSNLGTLITEFVINFLIHFYSPKPIFMRWSVYFFLIIFPVRTVTASTMNYEPYTTDNRKCPSWEFRDGLAVQMQHVTKCYTRPRILAGSFQRFKTWNTIMTLSTWNVRSVQLTFTEDSRKRSGEL